MFHSTAEHTLDMASSQLHTTTHTVCVLELRDSAEQILHKQHHPATPESAKRRQMASAA
jgi:hypothetical protein